jgi:hypothetical protein
MTQMAKTDHGLATMLGTLDRRRSPIDQRDSALRCHRSGLSKTER